MMNRTNLFLLWLISNPAGALLVAGLFLLVPGLARRIEPSDYTPTIGYSSEAQSSRNTSVVGRLFGEFRTSMSDVMFIKTERYLHSGIAYTKTVEQEGEAGGKPIDTLIRTPDQDWRGFIGDFERKIKPWLDPKNHAQHTKGTELLPWFRLMTLVNPHRIRGYQVGAFLLRTTGLPDATDQARGFVQEGINNNPLSHELQFTMVRIIQQQLQENQRDHPDQDASVQESPIVEALTYARKGVELGAASRPAQGWQGKGRPAEMEDSFIGCMHYEIFFLRRLGRSDEALARASELLKRFGPDPILKNEIEEINAERAGKS
jgi:hypothetical protein